MNKVLIFGGTGFIGLSLARHLKEGGFIPIIIARKRPEYSIDYEFLQWDAVTLGPWVKDLDNAKAIVAESIYNRSKLSSGYEKADGIYTGIVNKFYDVSYTAKYLKNELNSH